MTSETRNPTGFDAAITALRQALGGEAILPGDAEYDAARQIYNVMIDKRPAVIVRCAGTADVVTAVNFAREQGLEASVRGGGHNVAGNALTDGGLVIDLSRMRGVWVDPAARLVRAQGGCTLADLDRETQLHGLAVPAGTVSATGIAGLTLGGGYGWLMRKYGLACDNLTAVEIVAADGRVLRASENENADLYWGVRGGGGNFGVVTSFEYRAYSVGPIVLGGMIVHPMDRAKDVITFWNEFTRTAPDELGTSLALLTAPDGVPVVAILACWIGDLAAGEAAIRPLREFGPPVMDHLQPLPFRVMQTILDEGFGPGFCHYWKSSYLKDLDAGAIDTIVEYGTGMTSPLSATILEFAGGAVNRVPADATAFGLRDGDYNLLMVARWTDPADAGKHVDWARRFFQAMQPFNAASVYVNYLEEGAEGAARIKDAYGPNYDRLVELKNKYDPTNFFHRNQNIRPTV